MIGFSKFLLNLGLSLQALFKSFRLRPAVLNRLHVSAGQAALAALFMVLIGIAAAWVSLKIMGNAKLKVNPRALEADTAYIVALLACSALAAHFASEKKAASPSALLIFTLLCLASGILSVLGWALHTYLLVSPYVFSPYMPYVIQWGLIAWFYWLVLVNFRKGLLLCLKPSLIAAAPLLVTLLFHLKYEPAEFWFEAPTAINAVNPATEDTLEAQSALLPTKIATLANQTPGVTDFYFIGFAPFSTEDVFSLELDAIVPMIENRFVSKGKTIRLSNHNNGLNKYPFATVANLRRALFAIAAKMDAQEDVFVLYITSHGSKDHRIASRFPPFEFNEITPALLASLLDAAGIKNRVLIISACYSGGFIEPLKNANTLIMTAAAADRPSFGCGTDSTFTYFGKAVMDEQLGSKTRSFEDAFINALPGLSAREKAMGFESSKPQMSVGSAIGPLLKNLD
jgi:uncharacterized membrane protein YgdD (TMEM256/DUF423 family)